MTREECIYEKNLYEDYYKSECHLSNWLNSFGSLWTLNRVNNADNQVFYADGSILRMSANSTTKAVYPTVYLSSDVKIISGNGTMENPYGLSVN